MKEFLYKPSKFRYRCLIQIQNQIMNQFRICIEIQLFSLQPTFMLLYCLPVLPANKRPIMFFEERKIIVSDLNIFYKKVICRNYLFFMRKKTCLTVFIIFHQKKNMFKPFLWFRDQNIRFWNQNIGFQDQKGTKKDKKRDQKRDKILSVIPYKAFHQGN